MKRKILIVEDESVVAVDIKMRLGRLGYSAITVSSANAALARAADWAPDLVLMDIRLRDGDDGIQAAADIARTHAIPVVFLTAHADSDTINRTKKTDPFGYLVKPFEDRELHSCIEISLHRHALELEIRRREGWYRSILTCIGSAVIVTDTKHIITFINPLAEQMTGWTLEEANGKKLSTVITLLAGEGGPTITLPSLKDLTVPKADPFGLRSNVVLIGKDRRETFVDETAAAIRDSDGNKIGLVIAFRDVTDRQRVGQRLLSRQKIEAVGKLARGIAHEFGNIATLITGYASSLADTLIAKSRSHQDAVRILEAATHAHELTNRLLTVARASSPQETREAEPVALGPVLKDTSELVRGMLSDHNIELQMQDAGNTPVVLANGSELLETLMILFMNAADAMPNGGTMTVDTRIAAIQKPNLKMNPAAKGGQYGIVRVKDTGCGMAPETIEQVFDPFFSTKDSVGAKGLGLAIAHNTVNAWGGWISVRSKLDIGTTFNVYIPLASTPVIERRSPELTGHTILLIDDCSEDLAAMTETLEDAGYKVHAATSGRDGLVLHDQHATSISLTIVDLIMPDVDGKEVVATIAERKSESGVIVTSGFSRDYVRAYLGKGGWSFLQKPVEHDLLLAAVRRAIERLAAHRSSVGGLDKERGV
ncbi:MAG: response regulator [Lentisphaerales bacterium]|nr:MAG: response regulator [Lentisphaerales bacterium]